MVCKISSIVMFINTVLDCGKALEIIGIYFRRVKFRKPQNVL